MNSEFRFYNTDNDNTFPIANYLYHKYEKIPFNISNCNNIGVQFEEDIKSLGFSLIWKSTKIRDNIESDMSKLYIKNDIYIILNQSKEMEEPLSLIFDEKIISTVNITYYCSVYYFAESETIQKIKELYIK